MVMHDALHKSRISMTDMGPDVTYTTLLLFVCLEAAAAGLDDLEIRCR